MSTVEEVQDAHDHPSDALYWKVGLFLAAVTALEVSTAWWPESASKFNNTALIVMMIIKFGVVAAFFMHLKFDSKLLSRVLLLALGFVIVIYGVFLGAMNWTENSGNNHFPDAPRIQPVPPKPTDPTTPIRVTSGH